MYLKTKKGVSELISFTLLTLLITITSLSSYYYVSSSFDEISIEKDYSLMVNFLNEINIYLPKLTIYDQSSSIFFISFETGSFIVSGNSLAYQSQIPFTSNSVCLDSVCYQNNNNFERINVSFNEFNFSSNFSLIPGTYKLQFIYQKNTSQMNIYLE